MRMMRPLRFLSTLVVLLLFDSLQYARAAACQACLFSIPFATNHGHLKHHHHHHHRHPHHHQPQSVPVQAQFTSALLPFGYIAARYFATTPRYNSWLLRMTQTKMTANDANSNKKRNHNNNNNDSVEEANEDERTLDRSDTLETPPDTVMSSAAIGALRFYKGFISPLLPPACRFVPTCSQYGVQAIQDFGTTRGCILIAWRLLRCSPIGGKGYDPPQWPPVPYTYSSY